MHIQHFLLEAQARKISLPEVAEWDEETVRSKFQELRWPETGDLRVLTDMPPSYDGGMVYLKMSFVSFLHNADKAIRKPPFGGFSVEGMLQCDQSQGFQGSFTLRSYPRMGMASGSRGATRGVKGS